VALRIIIGLVLTVLAAAVAGRRVWWLYRLAAAGEPAPERFAAVRRQLGEDVKSQLTEVFGQRKLLKWSVPGAAHFFTFWGFIILIFTIIEAYGDLFQRNFAIPGIGHSFALGFLEDLFAVAVLAALIFNALVIPALIPLALRGVRFRPATATALLRRNMLVYGLGGVLLPFAAIKLIDLFLVLVFGA